MQTRINLGLTDVTWEKDLDRERVLRGWVCWLIFGFWDGWRESFC